MQARVFIALFALGAALAAVPNPAFAQEPERTLEAGAEAADDAAADGESGSAFGLGMALDLSFASAYYFRGANVFSGGDASDQHGFLGTTLTYDLLESGFSISWWSATQILGDNRADLVDEGVGGEQGLSLNFEHEISGSLSLSSYAFVYFYPFAESQSGPFLDLCLSASHESLVEIELQAAIYTTLSKYDQDQKYFYASVVLGKSAEILEGLELGSSVSLGYKVMFGSRATSDNTHDIRATLQTEYAVSDFLSVGLSLNWAWSDLEETDSVDEHIFWAEVFVGIRM